MEEADCSEAITENNPPNGNVARKTYSLHKVLQEK